MQPLLKNEMSKQTHYAGYVRLLFSEDSMKIKKRPGTSSEATFFVNFFDKMFLLEYIG